jgi:Tripartite tricarboxylate transporter TctB family
MQIRIRNGKDFYAGLFFFFIGIVTVLEARSYSVGTVRSMGPGYFPNILGYLLLVIGGGTAVRGIWLKGEGIKISSIRPLLMVSGAVLSFAFLLRPAGLILALLALVFISCLGSREFRIRDVVILFFVLAAIATVLFVYALGLPYHLFWSK